MFDFVYDSYVEHEINTLFQFSFFCFLCICELIATYVLVSLSKDSSNQST